MYPHVLFKNTGTKDFFCITFRFERYPLDAQSLILHSAFPILLLCAFSHLTLYYPITKEEEEEEESRMTAWLIDSCLPLQSTLFARCFVQAIMQGQHSVLLHDRHGAWQSATYWSELTNIDQSSWEMVCMYICIEVIGLFSFFIFPTKITQLLQYI